MPSRGGHGRPDAMHMLAMTLLLQGNPDEVLDLLKCAADLGHHVLVRSEADARELLRAVCAELNINDAGQDIPPEAMLVQLLAFAGQDAAIRDILLGILADPPVNRQMAVAEYIGDPLLIGALVTLLQTRLRIKIKSDGVKRSYEVQVDKAAADASIISAVLARFNGPAS
jgi:hypothetical protein